MNMQVMATDRTEVEIFCPECREDVEAIVTAGTAYEFWAKCLDGDHEGEIHVWESELA